VLARSQIQEVFPLAACSRLAENSRLGFATVASTSQWASGFSISSNTLGLSGTLYDGRVRPRSTGKERDAESGNDYFEARYYSSAMGRFMSPDWSAKEDPVPYADLEDPQSLNLYLYMQNNPLGGVDADGHLPPWIAQKMQQAKQWAADHPRTTMAVGGALLVTAAVVAAPEVLAAAAVAETVTEGLAVGTAALGVTGTAVNGTTQILAAATNGASPNAVNEATNAVTAVTNPVAGGVSLATGSTEKGSQAGDLATVAKAGVGLTQGKAPNVADVASSLGGAKAAVSSIVHSVSGALAPTPSAPPAPAAPKPPSCATSGHC
jgi:RHS repeat-associated protein